MRSAVAVQMLALLVSFSCAGCAGFEKSVAQAPAPQPAAAPSAPSPVAEATPPRFECSDGTISISQDACQIAMARARLPPSQTAERTSNPSSSNGASPTTGAAR